MIEKLCGLYGVAGDDGDVCAAVIEELKDYDINYEYMKNGNLIVFKKGRRTPEKKLMVCAHTDEVGVIITGITDEGYLKFDCVGGIDSRILLSQRIFIGAKQIPGIIGIKAIHLAEKEEREKTVGFRKMYIDIGAKNKEDALSAVSVGDYGYFEKSYCENAGRIISKALDDRAGVYILTELLKNELEYDLTACFNTAEEIGCKGALTSARRVRPDYAVILEGTTCSDTGGVPPHLRSTILGEGPAISVRDFGARSDREFNGAIIDIAEKNGIKYQLKRTHKGGNDASAVQLAGSGVKAAVISVPLRYIHSPASVMDKADCENALRLIKAVADNFGKIVSEVEDNGQKDY